MRYGLSQGDFFPSAPALDSRRARNYVGARNGGSDRPIPQRPLITQFIQACAGTRGAEHPAADIAGALARAYWNRLVEGQVAACGSDPPEDLLELQPPWHAAPTTTGRGLPPELRSQIERLSGRLAKLDVLEAGYWIGMVYTALLPKEIRGKLGVYYTPPLLSERLLDLAEEAGVDWGRSRVLDPACGGGAFLAPLARRIRIKAAGETPLEQLERVARQVHGFEIDHFGAWLSQVLLEAEMLETCCRAGRRLPVCVTVVDTLGVDAADRDYDLVVGNPPYGRTTLEPDARAKYARSVHGHANLYGVFTDQALRLANANGVVAFITPTSFLSGQYFKKLRSLIARTAPPISIDFVEARSGVFEDVLQETALVVFRRGAPQKSASVHALRVSTSEAAVENLRVGEFKLPADPSAPWIIPRNRDAAPLALGLDALPHRLRDYGYRVKTGPLVWNRHKDQLRERTGRSRHPIIWAEAVSSDGSFAFRAEKRNHAPFFEAHLPTDDWLLTRAACVLLQRTTAKEQKRRLVAARIPDDFVVEHGAVVIENHLNMLVASDPELTGPVTPDVLVALLNSAIVDQAFRCMNGSVAVSAFELEALPLPGPDVLADLGCLLAHEASAQQIEDLIERSYLDAGSAERAALGRDSAAA